MLQESSSGNKLLGFYRGKVLKHLSNGFCKIFIPSVYPEEWNNYENADRLPSAEQASPISFGCNNGLGVFSYPNIGSVVWCFFANGDQNLPVYFASTLGGDKAVSPGNWDKARAMAGSHPDDAYVHKIHVKNSDIEIYETGMVKVHTESKQNNCNLTLDQSGNIIVDSTTSITFKTKIFKIDAETQVDIVAPNLKSTNDIHATIISPAIELNSKAGHTTIISKTGTTTL